MHRCLLIFVTRTKHDLAEIRMAPDIRISLTFQTERAVRSIRPARFPTQRPVQRQTRIKLNAWLGAMNAHYSSAARIGNFRDRCWLRRNKIANQVKIAMTSPKSVQYISNPRRRSEIVRPAHNRFSPAEQCHTLIRREITLCKDLYDVIVDSPDSFAG